MFILLKVGKKKRKKKIVIFISTVEGEGICSTIYKVQLFVHYFP